MRGIALHAFECFLAQHDHDNNFAGMRHVMTKLGNVVWTSEETLRDTLTSQMSAIEEDRSVLEVKVFAISQDRSLLHDQVCAVLSESSVLDHF